MIDARPDGVRPESKESIQENSVWVKSHLGAPLFTGFYQARGNLININNKALVEGGWESKKGQRSVEGKGKEEALPILDLLIRVRTALGISYILSLLNDYISLGQRDISE